MNAQNSSTQNSGDAAAQTAVPLTSGAQAEEYFRLQREAEEKTAKIFWQFVFWLVVVPISLLGVCLVFVAIAMILQGIMAIR